MSNPSLSRVSRRDFILTAGIAGAGTLTFQSLAHHAAFISAAASGWFTFGVDDCQTLSPKKSNNTGEELLELPKDFQYTVIGKAGTKMSDGCPNPGRPDGMAAFPVRNELRLIRNHEVKEPGPPIGPKQDSYDSRGAGGTTTLVIDPNTRKCVKAFVSLSGTSANCAGGKTPWNSWISCEEPLAIPEKPAIPITKEGFQELHGYCFEVDAAADGAIKTPPLIAMGRFKHEAVAVDENTGIVYLTEDDGVNGLNKSNVGFYRFVPTKPPKKPGDLLQNGGQLEMLKVEGISDVRTSQKVDGHPLSATWVRIPDPSRAVFKQGKDNGATTFARLEGCVYGKGGIYFDSTNGGVEMLGQVWKYVPDGRDKDGRDKGNLTLLCQPEKPSDLNMPDNICLDEEDNVLICEDNKGAHQTGVHLRIMNQKGEVRCLAKIIHPRYSNSEFAGATFSPDFKTLFVNIQDASVEDASLTLAIWGP